LVVAPRADCFGVSASSAIRWRQLALEHGQAVAKPRGGDRHSGKIEAHGGFIRELVAERGDMTLVEIQTRLVERGVSVGIGTLHRFFVRHGITRKQRPGTRSSKTAPMS
jgi:transposase